MKTNVLASSESKTKWHPAKSMLMQPTGCVVSDGELVYEWFKRDPFDIRTERWGHPTVVQHSRTAKLVTPPLDLWMRFVRLGTGGAEDIRRFAMRYGALESGAPHSEKLEQWNSFSRLAFAISAVTEAVHRGNAGSLKDWNLILAWLNVTGPAEVAPQSANLRRLLIAASIQRWLQQPHCYLPSVLWRGDSLQIKPVALGVLGVVGLQLAVQLTRTQITICSGCPSVIEPSSRATRGSRRYCPKCRIEKKPIKDAKADFRRRRKEASI